jgi:hypothetical protein
VTSATAGVGLDGPGVWKGQAFFRTATERKIYMGSSIAATGKSLNIESYIVGRYCPYQIAIEA